MRVSSRMARWPALLMVAVLAACREDAEAPTSPESLSTADVVQTPAFRQVAAGWYHTCGVATDSVAWCWGLNRDGAVGDGTTVNRSTPTRVKTSLRFRQISAGGFST
jgi:alpha-tubulin suppressor-like RCC1 family protein